MKPLSQEARVLLDAARAVDAPSDAYRERMRQRLAMSLGGVVAVSTAAVNSKAAATPTGAAKTVGSAIWIKAGIASLALGILTGSAALLWPNASPAQVAIPTRGFARLKPPPSTLTLSEALPAPSKPLGLEAPTKAQTERLVVQARRPRQMAGLSPRAKALAPTSSTPATNPLNDELMLLSRAQGALSGGNAELALNLLDTHEKAHPEGALREERMAARVFALCALGRQEEARTEAQRFVTIAPRSPLATRVRGACGEGAGLKNP